MLGCCGGEGRAGGNASTERAPRAPKITTHLAVLQGAALEWEFIDLCTPSVESNLQELRDVRVRNSGDNEHNSLMGCVDVSEEPAASDIGWIKFLFTSLSFSIKTINKDL